MRKIRLDLAGLMVESFDLSHVKEEARGTVEAHSRRPCPPENTNLCPTNIGPTCEGAPDTCVLSCPGNFCCATNGEFSCLQP